MYKAYGYMSCEGPWGLKFSWIYMIFVEKGNASSFPMCNVVILQRISCATAWINIPEQTTQDEKPQLTERDFQGQFKDLCQLDENPTVSRHSILIFAECCLSS